ncbi:hypothetical protein VOLCADRAFT_57174 [Volvox carteri f. nagariensis]|uniref:PROP1-like PPR domain-containing protein n=1 Tax=Volvox carteri f. nagariensis TaxID=3068 RepID=D8TLP9_VOLCA|nr:uncharacterized protein VOLCADRAFT_57174 [Volvox carteri f. nagariensis]EFJ51366.1 hypothetical protein VOLCADRAFT_57174 [Volvox carteri f. nagariensis]|eukprot:XP_002947318.1 hypothetical protein VOLCADRAFT_57174 [Volvox carteri f. nagariensis]
MVSIAARPPLAAAGSGTGSLPARVTGHTRQNQSHNALNAPAVVARAPAQSSARSTTRTSAAPGAPVMTATERVRKSIDRSHERRSMEQRSHEQPQTEPLEQVAEDPLERLSADLTALSLQHAAAMAAAAAVSTAPPSSDANPAAASAAEPAISVTAPAAITSRGNRHQQINNSGSNRVTVTVHTAAPPSAPASAVGSGSSAALSKRASATGLPAQLLALRDPACPVSLPPPGGLPASCLPLDNWKLDKLVLALSANKATWRRSLLLFEWLKAAGHQLDDRLCTTLIRVCSDHGDAVSALAVYDWMTGSTAAGGAGLEATAYTYTAAMRAALAGGLTDRAMSIWNEAWRRHTAGRLQMDCRLCITYLELCTRLGLTDQALAMYGAMRAAPPGSRMAPTVHAYTAAMRAATEGGRWYRALDIWADMRASGCEPTGHAFSAAISACAPAGDWSRAVALFDEMTGPAGIRPDVVSCTALITALASGGEADRAEAVVAWMLANGVRPNARTYTALMAALGNAKRWSRAVEVLGRMQTPEWGGVQPNAYTYSALLKSLGEHGQWQLAEAVFSSIERQVLGPAAAAPPAAAALSLAAALASSPAASVPTSAAGAAGAPQLISPLTALLAQAAVTASVEAAASSTSSSAVAVAAAGGGMYDNPASYAAPQRTWTRPSQLHGLSLDLTSLAAGGTAAAAAEADAASSAEPSRRSFSLFSHPPAAASAAASTAPSSPLSASSFCVTDDVPLRAGILQAISSTEVAHPWRSALDSASAGTLASQLTAAAAAAAAAASDVSAFSNHVAIGHMAGAPGSGVPSAPVAAAAAAASFPLGFAANAVDMSAPSTAPSPATMLAGPPAPSTAVNHHNHHHTHIPGSSHSSPHHHGLLNEVVCGALMLAYERAGKWQEAVGVLLRAMNLGITPNTVMYNTAISAAGKAGQLEIAEKLYSKVRQPDTVTHETMIAAYGMAGLPDRAEAVFSALTAAGLRPRDFAFCGLIAAHSLAGDWEGAMRVRTRMRRAGVQPSADVYNALLAACERAGQPDKALELLGAMRRDGVEPNALTGQLLSLVGRQGVRSVEGQQVAAAALSAAVAAYGTLLMQTGLF